MRKILFALFVSSGLAQGAVSLSPGAGSAPNVITVPPGAGITALLAGAQADSAYQLGDGTYPVTASIILSNLVNNNTYSGILLSNKTNITITGIPGNTIIDSSSSLGTQMFLTNCSGITFYGITFRGYTNHNFHLLPAMTGANGYLWSAIEVFKSEKITFDNCIIERHADQGIQDMAANGSGVPANSPPSTNAIIIRNCFFEDIGNYRTNSPGGGTFQVDGTAVIPTGWTIENCTFRNVIRAIEPYDAADGTDVKVYNTFIKGNRIQNFLDAAIYSSDATNCHNVYITENHIVNDSSWTFHGTNISSTTAGGRGIYAPTGRGWVIKNNLIRGNLYTGIAIGGGNNQITDFVVDGNAIIDILDPVVSFGGYGIQVGNESGFAPAVRNCTIANNYIRNCRGGGLDIIGARDTYIYNNTIENPSTVAGLYGIAVRHNGSTINTNVWIFNNRINNYSGTMAAGVNVTSANININCNENVIEGGTAKYLNAAGDQLTIHGPAKTYSHTYNLPAIGAGANFITNFTATGTRTNDLVTFMVPSQMTTAGNSTNQTWTAWPSNDSVFFQVQAIQASDPQNIRIRAVVRQVEPY